VSKPPKKRLGDILVQAGVISEKDLERALSIKSTQRLGIRLIHHKLCTELDIAIALSTQLGIDRLDLHVVPIEPEATQTITRELAEKKEVIPLSIEGKHTLRLAMSDPLDIQSIDDVRFASGLEVETVVTTSSDIQWAIEKYYALHKAVDEIADTLEYGERGADRLPSTLSDRDKVVVREKTNAAPVVRMVNHILATAVEKKVSDIHLEPYRTKLMVRYRIDGYLQKHLELPKWVQGAVTSRLKVMAKMDIAEKRIPQDNRIGLNVADRDLDLRISSLPTKYGEKIVIRLLDAAGSPGTITAVGFDAESEHKFKDIISKPQGILLVTGPTGSGKTTTLYAGLSYIKDVSRNITTIEDPIEYELEGVNQVGINEKAGCTFPVVLTSLLRQDPDVIMIGEMRDLETATIAMQASLTGHLVLSTIHTNNTVATITRLRNLGIPSYLIASTINGIIAQRLVRKLCQDCKEPTQVSPDTLRTIGITGKQAGEITFYRGKGCEKCQDTGFSGRTGIYEVLMMSQRLREQISKDASETTIRQFATAEGMKTLMHAGIDKVIAGETSVNELIRVTQMAGDSGSLCPDCGYVIGAGYIACPKCGLQLTRACSGCNNTVDLDWDFCPYCANRLAEVENNDISRKAG
jgi:type IV pilus assembly protein PilB